MIDQRYNRPSVVGAGLALTLALALSGCGDKDKQSTPVANSAAVNPLAEPSNADAYDANDREDGQEMHEQMEREQRQQMDHESMRGGSMTNAASPPADAQPADQAGSMQDM